MTPRNPNRIEELTMRRLLLAAGAALVWMSIAPGATASAPVVGGDRMHWAGVPPARSLPSLAAEYGLHPRIRTELDRRVMEIRQGLAAQDRGYLLEVRLLQLGGNASLAQSTILMQPIGNGAEPADALALHGIGGRMATTGLPPHRRADYLVWIGRSEEGDRIYSEADRAELERGAAALRTLRIYARMELAEADVVLRRLEQITRWSDWAQRHANVSAVRDRHRLEAIDQQHDEAGRRFIRAYEAYLRANDTLRQQEKERKILYLIGSLLDLGKEIYGSALKDEHLASLNARESRLAGSTAELRAVASEELAELARAREVIAGLDAEARGLFANPAAVPPNSERFSPPPVPAMPPAFVPPEHGR